MLLGLLLVALAAASWGTTGTTLELIGASSTSVPLVVGAMRMLVAAPLLAAGARLAGDRLRPLRPAAPAAGLCMGAYQLCYFSAVPLAGVATTALLAICSAPILVTVLARILLGERLTPLRLIALGLGVLGAGLLVGGAPAEPGTRLPVGSSLAVGAGLAYSLYAVLTKGALASSPPLALAAVTFTVAAAALLPILTIQPAVAASTAGRGWPLLLYLGIVPTAGAYWLYTTGLRRLPAGVAAVAGLLEPLTATALGLALFHERLHAIGVLGAVLLLLAMTLLGAVSARRVTS